MKVVSKAGSQRFVDPNKMTSGQVCRYGQRHYLKIDNPTITPLGRPLTHLEIESNRLVFFMENLDRPDLHLVNAEVHITPVAQ